MTNTTASTKVNRKTDQSVQKERKNFGSIRNYQKSQGRKFGSGTANQLETAASRKS